MCEIPGLVAQPLSRRHFLAAGPVAAAVLALPLPGPRRLRTVTLAPGLDAVPRRTWGPDLTAPGPIPDEPDVRFVIIHHSVTPNTYDGDGVVGVLRAIHRFHTGERGWPDIAYNFFVDRFGGVWEGRTGSIERPVAGDATGGNQGFSQLCCFLGDHSHEPPTPAAQEAMGRLLGWLADRSGVDVSPDATATFVSRGSNRHPAGTAVTTPTVAGHRDMSLTACPGDAAHTLVVDGTFARLAAAASQASPVSPATTEPPAADPGAPPARPDPTTPAQRPAPGRAPAEDASDAGSGAGPPGWLLGSGAALAAGVATATAALLRRRQAVARDQRPAPPP